MVDLALADNQDWGLILTQAKQVLRHSDRLVPYSLYEYDPISPIYCTPNSNLLLIGTKSNSAKPYWFLGAIASQFLYLEPLGSNYKVSGIQANQSKKIGLDRLTLVEFKDYGVNPYVLELSIPHWIEDIEVRVWEYLNPIIPDINTTVDRLNGLEDKLDVLLGRT